jgi:two-component system chemotaxis response regulator CheY
MAAVRVLSVGQCGIDHWSISRFLGRAFGAHVDSAGTHEEALAALEAGRFDLLLVNRICDADGAPGVELIRSLKSNPATADLPVMLVSDHASAQNEAIGLGALPGFGKRDVGNDTAVRVIGQVISPSD